MILILMNRYYALVIREELFSKLFSYFKDFCRSNLLIPMEANDIVSIHSAIILVPKLLFFKPGLIDLKRSYLFRSIRMRKRRKFLLTQRRFYLHIMFL